MPGVSVGDIGAKMGRDGIDNGWIQFSGVQNPQIFMLQKFTKVTAEGRVTLPLTTNYLILLSVVELLWLRI